MMNIYVLLLIMWVGINYISQMVERLHLSNDVFKVFGELLNRMRVHPFISSHHNFIIFGTALDLFLNIALFMSTLVITSANY